MNALAAGSGISVTSKNGRKQTIMAHEDKLKGLKERAYAATNTASCTSIEEVIDFLSAKNLLKDTPVAVEDLEPGTRFRGWFKHSDGTEFIVLKNGLVYERTDSISDAVWPADNSIFTVEEVLN